MCHQSVGLISRHLEAQGIPTLSMTSAWSITASVNPPRAAFLDFPLGHTAGRPDEAHEQIEIMRAALGVFEEAPRGSITRLPFEWHANDNWKAEVMAGTTHGGSDVQGDDRVERFDTPQYQSAEDAQIADASCPTCIWL